MKRKLLIIIISIPILLLIFLISKTPTMNYSAFSLDGASKNDVINLKNKGNVNEQELEQKNQDSLSFKKINLIGNIKINYYSLYLENTDIDITTSNISIRAKDMDISVGKDNRIIIKGFNGKIDWRDSRFILKGTLKDYSDEETTVKINTNQELLFEINNGNVILMK